MLLRIIAITVVLVLAVSAADAGVIISPAVDGMAVSACDFDSSETPDEESPFFRDGKSQGMSASVVTMVKSSNSQALEDSARLFLPTFKPRCPDEYENAELPPNPILDGLLKPS